MKNHVAAFLRLLADVLNAGHPVMNYRGVPTAACPCGSTLLTVQLVIDPEDYEVAGWLLDGECAECGALLTVACPLDHPEYEGSV